GARDGRSHSEPGPSPRSGGRLDGNERRRTGLPHHRSDSRGPVARPGGGLASESGLSQNGFPGAVDRSSRFRGRLMAEELICGSCGRRWTPGDTRPSRVCPECSVPFGSAESNDQTAAWLPKTDEIPVFQGSVESQDPAERTGESDDFVLGSTGSGPV